MEKVSLKRKARLFILLSCTYVHAGTMPIGKDKKVHTKSHHRKKEIKKLLTRFKGEIIGTTLLVIAGGVFSLAIWKSKQATSSETSHKDHTQKTARTVEKKFDVQPQNVELKQPQSLQPSQNDTASSTENHTDSTQTTTQSVERKLDVEPQTVELDQPQEPQLPQSHITLVEDTLSLALSKEIKKKLEEASKGKEKIKLKKTIPLSGQVNNKVNVNFLDDENIIYHVVPVIGPRSDKVKSFFQYNIPKNIQTETTVFEKEKDGNIVFLKIIDPFLDDKRRKLISGFCREEKDVFIPADLRGTICSFYKSMFIALMDIEGNTITYDPIKNQIVRKKNFLKNQEHLVERVLIDPKGRLLAVADHSDIDVYDFSTGEHQGTLHYSKKYNLKIMYPNFHPSGEALLLGGSMSDSFFEKLEHKNPIRVWNFKTKKEATTLFEIDKNELFLPLLYDNGESCIITREYSISIWNVKEKKMKTTLIEDAWGCSVVMHPNKKFLTAAGSFGIKIWHLASNKEVFNFKWPDKVLKSLKFNSNGESMVATWFSNSSDMSGVLIFENINAMLNEWLADNAS